VVILILRLFSGCRVNLLEVQGLSNWWEGCVHACVDVIVVRYGLDFENPLLSSSLPYGDLMRHGCRLSAAGRRPPSGRPAGWQGEIEGACKGR
jgi:hypothetical protein